MDRKVYFDKARALVFGSKMAEEQVDGMSAILDYWDDREGLTDWRYLAYMMATTYHETAHTMQPISERGQISYFNKYEPGRRIGGVLGNKVKGDGYRYRGRGYVQLTGRSNYARMGRLLGVDLVGYPDLALNPELAAKIMFEGMLAGKSYRGDFTGKKLEDYFTDNKTDWINARRIINGTDEAELIAGYARKFYTALVAADIPLKSPEALQPQRSRTVQASTAVGTIGAGITASAVTNVGTSLIDALGADVFGIAVGVSLVALAAYLVYARWDDAGRPSVKQILGTHEKASTLDQKVE